MEYESLNLGPRLPYLCILRLNFLKNTLVRFEATLDFSNFKVSCKNRKSLNLELISKSHLGVSTAAFKNYCHIWKQRVIPKFRAKIEIIKFGPKRPDVGVLGRNFEKLLSYVKSAPSNSSYCKVWCKNENS